MCKSQSHYKFCTCNSENIVHENMWVLNRDDPSGARWIGSVEPPILESQKSFKKNNCAEIIDAEFLENLANSVNLPNAFDFHYEASAGDELLVFFNDDLIVFENDGLNFILKTSDDIKYPPFNVKLTISRGTLKNVK